MRVLGIDYGDSKVGVAITDSLGITSQGLETINYSGNKKDLLKRLDEIVLENDIKTIVIGMPYNMDGSKTKRAEVTEEFILKLKSKYTNINIEMVDERLTSLQAKRTMNELNINKKKKKDLEDTIAAVYILEVYIGKNE